jgi:toxin FitB
LNFLIDTNVISEPRRPKPDRNVLDWFNRTDQADVFISVLTLGELARGSAKAAQRDATAGLHLQRWIDEVNADFVDRIIDVDRNIATLWGKLISSRTMPVVDSLLAATAIVREMTLVTRNVRDIADTGVTILNPWEG